MTQGENGGAKAPPTLNPDNPQPGVYDGVSAELYHGLDLISASGLTTLDSECPALYRHEQDCPRQAETKWDLGTAAHLIFLEPHDFAAKVECLEFDSYQSKAARLARDDARENGRTPLRAKDYATVSAMREALVRQVGDLFVGGVAERTYIWKDPRTGVSCKARPDYVRPSLLLDYKTSESANPRSFRARCWDNGHHIQCWLYLFAHELLTGERANWRWVVQSTKPPYLVTAHKPTASLLGWAEQQARAALQQYARCLQQGRWPGYGDAVFPVELPQWAMYQLCERSENGEFRLDTAPKRAKKPLKPVEVERSIGWASPLSGGLT